MNKKKKRKKEGEEEENYLRWCSTSLPGGNQVDGLPPASSLQEKTGEENYFPKNS